LALGCVVLAALATVLAGQSVAHAFRSGHAHTVERRLDLWRSSMHMIQDHPIVGVGPDNFLHYYAPRSQLYIQCAHGLGYMYPEASEEPCQSHPHDEFLDFWLSTGVVGLAAFFWLQFTFWRAALAQWHGWNGSLQTALLLGSAGAMLAALVHGLVDNSYFLVDLAIIFWTLCMLASPRDGSSTQLSAALS
jgi:O-antigen ligase